MFSQFPAREWGMCSACMAWLVQPGLIKTTHMSGMKSGGMICTASNRHTHTHNPVVNPPASHMVNVMTFMCCRTVQDETVSPHSRRGTVKYVTL